MHLTSSLASPSSGVGKIICVADPAAAAARDAAMTAAAKQMGLTPATTEAESPSLR